MYFIYPKKKKKNHVFWAQNTTKASMAQNQAKWVLSLKDKAQNYTISKAKWSPFDGPSSIKCWFNDLANLVGSRGKNTPCYGCMLLWGGGSIPP